MVYNDIVKGRYVNLRSVEEEDAEYTLSLRKDPNLTKYIPKLEITLKQQVEWINKQRHTEGDYFFVVENKNGEKVGVVGVYEIQGNHAETGRVVIRGNAIESIEAQYLLYIFSFDILGMEYTTDYRMADNSPAIRSAIFFGADLSSPHEGANGLIIEGRLTRDSFHAKKKKIEKMLYKI